MSRFRIETMPAGVPGPAGAGEIVHLVMDDPARAVNVLDGPALDDLEAALAELEARPGLGGVVVRSGKRGSFATGADLEAFGPLPDRDAVRSAIGRAQGILARLAALPCPTVAAIDGACVGGGAELALACGSRVAADEPHTRIGLPEVLLGGIPAFGGTVRLPRLVGTATALDLLLSGRLLDARQAERAGLVALSVPGAWLLEHAHRRLAGPVPTRRAGAPGTGAPASGWRAPAADRWRPRGIRAWLADGTAAGRALAFSRESARTRARTRGEYPAPRAVLSVVRHAAALPMEAALRLEAEWASDLAVGPVCRNLVRAYHLAGPGTVSPRPGAPGLASAGPGVPGPDGEGGAAIERMHVVGAGALATDLTELAVRRGIEVRLRDGDPAALAGSLRSLRARIAGRAAVGRLAPQEAAAELARIRPGLEPTGLGRADLAVEMVAEELDAKRRVFAELEVRMRPGAVLATSTGTLSVDELAAGLGRPERFVGLHFLHPLPRRLLVEVVRGAKTSGEALATAVALVRRLGRIPLVVKDAPGFLVGRVVMAGLREALHLLEDGYRVTDVDGALRGFGMAAGPFETLDETGLDVAARLAALLARAFPERFAPSPQLEALVAAGRRGGAGGGSGFYRYRQGRRTPDPQAVRIAGAAPRRRPAQPGALAERVVLAMVNEAARCLADGVVPDAGALDLASLHGAGFPPFRGGLLRHADTLGLARVEARLNALRAENGERFLPAPLLVQLAAAGGAFTAPDAR